jgi:hypothetical protein
MIFIEGKLFHDKRRKLPFTKDLDLFYWQGGVMSFIEWSSSMIKERILPFTKGFWSILLSQSCDGIY